MSIQRVKELCQSLAILLDGWAAWETEKEYYLNELLPSLMADSTKGTKTEQELMLRIRSLAEPDEWEALPNICQWLLATRVTDVGSVSQQEATLKDYQESLPSTIIDEVLNQITILKEKHSLQVQASIEVALKTGSYLVADELYQEISHNFSKEAYEELKARYLNKDRLKRKVANLKNDLDKHLSQYDFKKADQHFQATDFLDKDEYELLKADYVKEYALKRLSIPINNEQAIALSKLDNNLLLRARAGSGKTRVLACKAALLMEAEGIDPNCILVMAFNRKAADEIKGRIRQDMKLERFNNARTFHSLAYQLVQPKEKLLFDEKGDFSTQKFSMFVQDVLRKIWSPAFQFKMYQTFRLELNEIERYGAHLNDEQYYLYRYNLRQVTLKGDKVKSLGEKYISDFLFEHDISFSYEKVWYWGNNNYRPDFTLFQNKKPIAIMEHWAIDEYKSDSRQLPKDWSKSREDYLLEQRKKRTYWEEKGLPLIETSVEDLREGREHFEAQLRKQLEDLGIVCHKLPEIELQRKVIRSQKIRMTELFAQFIQKAKKAALSPGDTKRLIDAFEAKDERTQIFLELALQVYEAYEAAILEQNAVDFDELMKRATDLINKTEGCCAIRLKNEQYVQMNELKYILIDEYQDFSKLFFNLLEAIRKHNASVKVFCVGDDWQAINGFAGSDLHYFENFTTLLPESGTADLLKNHRSHSNIVHVSNALMDGRGKLAQPLLDKEGGSVYVHPIDTNRIEARKDDMYAEAWQSDQKFVFKEGDNGNLKARYLKKCYEIILENKGKKIAILSRTWQIHYTELKDFVDKLISCFTQDELKEINFKDKVQFGSVHSFKGLEAKVVIILNVCKSSFPMIHPDNALFTVFGQTARDVMDEEQRLFYVGLSRAEDETWILTEKGRESDFLEIIQDYCSVSGLLTAKNEALDRFLHLTGT